MQNGGVQVVTIGGLVHGFVGPFVAFSVGDTALDAAAGQPRGEGVRIVVAAFAALTARHATEFRRPNDDGAVEQAAGFQVLYQGCGCLVHACTHVAVVLGKAFVGVP